MNIKDPLKNQNLGEYYLARLYSQLNPISASKQELNKMPRTVKYYYEEALHKLPSLYLKQEHDEEILNPFAFLDYCNEILFKQETSLSQQTNYYEKLIYLLNTISKDPADLIEKTKILKGNTYLPSVFEGLFFFSNQPIIDEKGKLLNLLELKKKNSSIVLINSLVGLVNKRKRELGKNEKEKIQACLKIIIDEVYKLVKLPVGKQGQAAKNLEKKIKRMLEEQKLLKNKKAG